MGAPLGGAGGTGIVTLHRWSMTGSLMAPDIIPDPDDRANGLFGTSVAISSDGNVIAVGAPNPTNRGRVQVRRGTTWAAVDGGGDRGRFGEAITLSSDGDWLLIGAPEAGSAGSGQAVVRHWNGNSWDTVGVYLLPPPAGQTDGDRFGSSVAMAVRPDGRIVIAIGAPGRNSEAGAVYIFGVSGTTLGGPHLTLTSPSQPPGHFGAAVALSADGQHLAVGAPGSGQVFTYRSNDGYFWQRTADTLTYTGVDGFGQSVAISADGYVLGVGAPLNSAGSGIAFFYSRSGNSWVRRVDLPPGQPLSRAGESIAINAGGTAAMVGEPGFPAGRFTLYCAASGC